MLTLVGFGAFSYFHPISQVDPSIVSALQSSFDLSLWALVPAVLMLVLPLCNVPVGWALCASILSAFGVSVLGQGISVKETLLAAFWGYAPENPALASVLSGGGVVSMVSVALIVLLSGTFSGIFQGTRMLDGVQDKIAQWAEKNRFVPHDGGHQYLYQWGVLQSGHRRNAQYPAAGPGL